MTLGSSSTTNSLELDVDLLRPLKTAEWHDILRQCLDSLLPASLFDHIRLPALSIIQRKIMTSAQDHTLRVVVKAKTGASTIAAGLHQQILAPTAASGTIGAGLASGISGEQSLSPEWFPPRLLNADEPAYGAAQFLLPGMIDPTDAVGKHSSTVPQESNISAHGVRMLHHLRSTMESEGRIRCNESVEVYLPPEYIGLGSGGDADMLTTVHSAHTDQNWLVASVCILAFFLITFSAVLFMHCKHRRIIVRKVQYPACNSVTVSTVHSCASSAQLISTCSSAAPSAGVVWTNTHPSSRNPPGTVSGFDGPPLYRSAPVCNCACSHPLPPDRTASRGRPSSAIHYKKYPCSNPTGWEPFANSSYTRSNRCGRSTQLSESAYRTTSRQQSHLSVVIEPAVQRNPLYQVERNRPPVALHCKPAAKGVTNHPANARAAANATKDMVIKNVRPPCVADQTCQTGSIAGSDIGSDADLDFMMDDPSGGDAAQPSTPDPTRCTIGMEMTMDDNWDCGGDKDDEPPSYNAAVSEQKNCGRCTCSKPRTVNTSADSSASGSVNAEVFNACSGIPTPHCSSGTHKSLKPNFHMTSAQPNQKNNPNNDKLIPLRIQKNKGVSGHFGSISQRLPSLTQGYNRKLEIIVDPNAVASNKKKEPGCTDDNASIFSCSSDSETSECQLSDYDCQMEAEHDEIVEVSPESVLHTSGYDVASKTAQVSLNPVGNGTDKTKSSQKQPLVTGNSFSKGELSVDGDVDASTQKSGGESTLTAFFHALTSEWRNGRPMTVRALKQKSHVKKQIRDGTTTSDITLQTSNENGSE
ncbi:uncharacterized protein LOC129587057 [Paramacrobiotus metropolitanus]|uniref:uncharacterized protein LOC129587057 n=1 Tax=Paramacrobiotus metropolitanus TaxID=2943436 RepID=UPI0024463351|nr:uncharacterized protein LOC129587057 [Paramacrobiotus metropolitanus]